MIRKKTDVRVRALTININKTDKNYKIIDELCFKAKNLYNSTIFILKQYFLINKKIKENADLTDLEKEYMKQINEKISSVNEYFAKAGKEEIFKEIGLRKEGETLHLHAYMYMRYLLQGSEAWNDIDNITISERIVAQCTDTWKSYTKALNDYFRNPSKYKNRPEMPRYKDKENGRYSFTMYGARQSKIIDGKLTFNYKALKDNEVTFNVPLGNYINRGKDNKCDLKTIVFTKFTGCYKMLITYNLPKIELQETKNRIASIEIGLSRLATVVNNIDIEPFSINGNPIKAINEHSYIRKAKAQSVLMKTNKKYSSNKIDNINLKRINKIKHYMHLSSTYIIRWCNENKIDTLIVGKPTPFKQSLQDDNELDKEAKKGFIQIPFDLFISQLQYKSENYGINFILVDSSNAKKTSFLEKEDPNVEVEGENNKGVIKSNSGECIHAQLNTAYQIARIVNLDYFNECKKIYTFPKLITMSNDFFKN